MKQKMLTMLVAGAAVSPTIAYALRQLVSVPKVLRRAPF
jgi:hypothetical protein